MVVFYSDLSITESMGLGEAQIDDVQSSSIMSHHNQHNMTVSIMHKLVLKNQSWAKGFVNEADFSGDIHHIGD